MKRILLAIAFAALTVTFLRCEGRGSDEESVERRREDALRREEEDARRREDERRREEVARRREGERRREEVARRRRFDEESDERRREESFEPGRSDEESYERRREESYERGRSDEESEDPDAPTCRQQGTCKDCYQKSTGCKWCEARFFGGTDEISADVKFLGGCVEERDICNNERFGRFVQRITFSPPLYNVTEIGNNTELCNEDYYPPEITITRCSDCVNNNFTWADLRSYYFNTYNRRWSVNPRGSVCLRDEARFLAYKKLYRLPDTRYSSTRDLRTVFSRNENDCRRKTPPVPPPFLAPKSTCEENLTCRQCGEVPDGLCTWCGGVLEFNLTDVLSLSNPLEFRQPFLGKCVPAQSASGRDQCKDVQFGTMSDFLNLGIDEIEKFTVKPIPLGHALCNSTVEWPALFSIPTCEQCIGRAENDAVWCQFSCNSNTLGQRSGGICMEGKISFLCPALSRSSLLHSDLITPDDTCPTVTPNVIQRSAMNLLSNQESSFGGALASGSSFDNAFAESVGDTCKKNSNCKACYQQSNCTWCGARLYIRTRLYIDEDGINIDEDVLGACIGENDQCNSTLFGPLVAEINPVDVAMINGTSNRCTDRYSPPEFATRTCEDCLQANGTTWCDDGRLDTRTGAWSSRGAICIRDELNPICNMDVVPFLHYARGPPGRYVSSLRAVKDGIYCNGTILEPAPGHKDKCEDNLSCDSCTNGNSTDCTWCSGVFHLNATNIIGSRTPTVAETPLFGKCIPKTAGNEDQCKDVAFGTMSNLLNVHPEYIKFSPAPIAKGDLLCNTVQWPSVTRAVSCDDCTKTPNAGWCQWTSEFFGTAGGICMPQPVGFLCDLVATGYRGLLRSDFVVEDCSSIIPPTPSAAASLANYAAASLAFAALAVFGAA